ncbi:hypothetical protein CDAR_472891 [Caerostris darwini]|uniref:Uncharacterized protein n=1 Tax=Caerostris darwini TaxID=1538125 RepID=A0AAV4V9L2_9ARAC|nr:hypothetical protein CDAR_472891 [Caerostris darwini]
MFHEINKYLWEGDIKGEVSNVSRVSSSSCQYEGTRSAPNQKGPGRMEKEFLVSIPPSPGGRIDGRVTSSAPKSRPPSPVRIGSQNCSERRLERPTSLFARFLTTFCPSGTFFFLLVASNFHRSVRNFHRLST